MAFHENNKNNNANQKNYSNNMNKNVDKGILNKVKHFPRNFKHYSTKKKVYISLSATAIVALLGVGVYSLTPMHRVRVAESQQNHLMENLKVQNKTPKSGKYQYNNANGVPDLDTLFKLRQHDQGITLRGQISIPNYKVDVPVYEGTNQYTLAWGAGTAKPNQQFGKGNYAVQGHNYNELGLAKNWFFSNFEDGLAPYNTMDLKYVKIPLNTMVYARDKNKVYEYKIVNRSITDSRAYNSGYVLTDNAMKNYKNKPILTMSTCYEQKGITYPSQRIILTGKYVKSVDKKDFKDMDQVFNGSLN